MRTLMAALRSLSRERPYSVIRGIFHGGHVFATMIWRVRVNAVFACMGYNLLTILTLVRQGKIAAPLKN